MLGRILARTAARASRPAGPAESTTAVDALRSRIWAHAADDDGHHAAAILETGEGYGAAAHVAVRAVESQLRDLASAHSHPSRPSARTSLWSCLTPALRNSSDYGNHDTTRN